MEKFTKVRNIGKGNMGACALARHNEDGRYYVIKQVDLTKLNKKERQQSLNEAKVLSSLRHPNIINYVDSFLARKSDHLCIVMEYADGGDLGGKIKHTHGVNFNQEQVLDWFIQVALSLRHIHSKKILHRDVKTQNIFLTQEGVCKIGDFGIARTLNSTFDQANTFVGTPYYLSPELILERPYDAQSDVWALGVVLYELMSLRHPFNANDMKSLMHRILKVQYEAPPHMYSAELRSIVAKLLVKDPQQRLRLSEIFELPIVIHRMQQWVQGGIVPSRYVASLIRHKQFPPGVNLNVNGQESPLPLLQSKHNTNHSQSDETFRKQLAAAAAERDRAAEEQRLARALQDDMEQKQHRREEIRNEFRGAKLKPKPMANMVDPVVVRAAGAPLPQPQVKGQLPAISGGQAKQHSTRSSMIAALGDEGSPFPGMKAGHLGELRVAPQYAQPNAYPTASAMPVRVQPSVRPVQGYNPSAKNVQPGPSSDIQQILERAAQQRAQGRGLQKKAY